MSSKLLNAILRTSFSSFINKSFNTINPGIKFQPNWHIDLIAEYLQATINGNIKRLIINMPPRALKSVCVSVAWPAWILGQDSTKRIMVASYAQSLSIKHSLDTRIILESNWYKQLYCKTILSKKHNLKNKFMTTNNGFRLATSVGGSATGEGGDVLIIDDPHNPTHIHSTKMRNKAIEWYEQTFSTRLNDKNDGIIVIVMQRLHTDDLSGYLSRSTNHWEVLTIPAIASQDLEYHINDKSFYMNTKETLHKSRDTNENYKKIELEMGNYNFAAQYLQVPITYNSGLLDTKLLHYYDRYPDKFDSIIQSWDTAVKVGVNSDYTVCTCWGIKGQFYYLIDLVRERLSYPRLKEIALDQNAKFNSKYVLIEDQSSGQSLIQDLKLQGLINILPQKSKLDKITRFASVVPYLESGAVLLPRQASWMSTLLTEITNFPHTEHDDIVDSISQFLNFIKKEKIAKPRIRVI